MPLHRSLKRRRVGVLSVGRTVARRRTGCTAVTARSAVNHRYDLGELEFPRGLRSVFERARELVGGVGVLGRGIGHGRSFRRVDTVVGRRRRVQPAHHSHLRMRVECSARPPPAHPSLIRWRPRAGSARWTRHLTSVKRKWSRARARARPRQRRRIPSQRAPRSQAPQSSSSWPGR